MTDMITWLRAQLDEGEAVAQAASAVWDDEDEPLLEWQDVSDVAYAHAQQNHPAVTLADIEAKRAILDAYEEAKRYYEGPGRAAPAGEVHGLWTAIQHLAYAYRHRPGYLPEWAPEGQQG
jgi:hypothetical protein